MDGGEAVAVDLGRGRADDEGGSDRIPTLISCGGTCVSRGRVPVGRGLLRGEELVLEDMVHDDVLATLSYTVHSVGGRARLARADEELESARRSQLL